MENISTMLAKMRSLKSATMSAHESRDIYFKTLFADPYGLKNMIGEEKTRVSPTATKLVALSSR